MTNYFYVIAGLISTYYLIKFFKSFDDDDKKRRKYPSVNCTYNEYDEFDEYDEFWNEDINQYVDRMRLAPPTANHVLHVAVPRSNYCIPSSNSSTSYSRTQSTYANDRTSTNTPTRTNRTSNFRSTNPAVTSNGYLRSINRSTYSTPRTSTNTPMRSTVSSTHSTANHAGARSNVNSMPNKNSKSNAKNKNNFTNCGQTFWARSRSKKAFIEPEVCPICLDKIQKNHRLPGLKMVKTDCNHAYHYQCLNQLKIHDSRCSVCRTTLYGIH